MRSRRSRRSGPAFRYSAWDGTQVGFDLDADALLDEMADELMYHGDLNAALRRMLQQGFQDRNGEQLRACGRCSRSSAQRRQRGAREARPRRRLRRHRRAARRDRRPGAGRDRAAHRRRPATRATSAARRSSRTSPQERRLELELHARRPRRAGCRRCRSYDFMDDAARAAVRGADGRAAPAADAELLQPDVRGHAERVARADGADEGHARRAQPDARAARARRGARLRRLHGAVRRLLPRQPEDPRRAARADGAARWPRCSRCSTR